MRNPKRCVAVLSVFGFAFAIGCGRDVTGPVPGHPEFVLLKAGTVAQVSAGHSHTCALRTDGTVACWGDNWMGQATPPAETFTQGGSHDHDIHHGRARRRGLHAEPVGPG